MKKLYILTFLLLSLESFSQTQAEMNQDAYNKYKKSDKELNEIYQSILSEYKSDSLFINNLKKSQRIWVQFRDAELEMKYPNYPDYIYGTIHPLCRALYLKELTDHRIITLKKWLRGSEEGDACNGSVKFIEEIDPNNMQKAFIRKDSTLWLTANIKKDYRIFGYKDKDLNSKKMILFSVFTDDVKNNPYNCKYGAYYESSEMNGLSLKYITTENDFIKMAILKNGKKVDEVYIPKKWVEFEK